MLKKVRKTRTDRRTDGPTDGHCHRIIRPFFKRAYKNKSLKIWFQMINFVNTSCAFLWNCTGMEANNLDLALVQVMAWWYQATSHYLRQCCYRSMSPNGVTKPQWLNCSHTGQWSEIPIPRAHSMNRDFGMNKWWQPCSSVGCDYLSMTWIKRLIS